jgi:hypothetical protein
MLGGKAALPHPLGHVENGLPGYRMPGKDVIVVFDPR